jgi:hypothetical protein
MGQTATTDFDVQSARGNEIADIWNGSGLPVCHQQDKGRP